MVKSFIGVPSIYPKLLELRQSKTAKFKQNKYMRETTELRYYQVIGSLHMMLLERMVLGDGTGLGKCLNSMTYVPSSKGLLQIKDLIDLKSRPLKEDTLYKLPKDFYILSNEGPQKASHLYYNGKAFGLEVRTCKGYELLGLPHHPILCPNNGDIIYQKLEDLKIGDYVCINRKGFFSERVYSINYGFPLSSIKKYNCPDFLEEGLAELLGYYVSEGSSSREAVFEISQSYDEIRERIRFLLYTLFGYKETGNNKRFDTTVIVYSAQIRGLFKHLGVNLEGKSEGQVIPHSILSSKKSVIASFLKGYFEGDGSVENSNGIVSCSSKSEELLKQTQLLLLQFGIISRRKKKWVKVKKGRNLYWILYFCGKDIEIFQKEIGFVSKRKRDLLEKISSMKRNTNDDIIPIGSVLLKQAMSDIISHLRELPEQKNFSIKGSGWKGLVGRNYKEKIESYIYKKRRLTYDGLREFLEIINRLNLTSVVSNYGFLKNIVEKNIFFDKVKSIERSKDEYFDLHVPEAHNFTGNGFINHNTLQGIATHSFALDRDKSIKLLVVCPKSAKDQWAEEYEKFTTGVTTRVVSNDYKKLSGYDARKLQYQEFKENNEDVLIMNYSPVRTEYELILEYLSSNFMVIYDEIQVFKNRKSGIHTACKFIAQMADRVYGLSATLIKNDLEEVWGVYDVIVPGLFGNITKFKSTFCKQKLMKLQIKGKTRYIPKITGYKNLKKFKDTLDPYFLIRRKEEVAEELPKLISKKVVLEMFPEQKLLYRDALSGILHEERVKSEYFEICDHIRAYGVDGIDEKTKKKYGKLKEKYDAYLSPEGKKRGKLAALTYCQMISNGPGLLNETGDSSKEEEFIRLMKEELLTEKVILFTRFKSGISFLEIRCDRNGIDHTKITGDCDDRERKKSRLRFQEDPSCNLIFITTAGSAALNLQAASVIIFYDTPWSYGDLVQTIGRAQRIGSLRDHILVIHMVNKGTIDLHVINKVTKKKDLSDAVVGDTAEGALDFVEHEESAVSELFNDLLKDAEGYK